MKNVQYANHPRGARLTAFRASCRSAPHATRVRRIRARRVDRHGSAHRATRVHRYRAEWVLKLLGTYADAALKWCRAERIPTVNTPNLRRAQRIPTESGGDVAS